MDNFPERFGFRSGAVGTHTSRTIMFAELSTLLAALPSDATRDAYFEAIIEGNVLAKDTVATRKLTARRMTELYGLTPAIPIFRILRVLWAQDRDAQPGLSLLCSLARDPLLRATAEAVLSLRMGEELTRSRVIESLRRETMERLNDAVLDKVLRNAASSWTQSGHLVGRVRKVRARAKATPQVVAYALVLGYLQGLRGARLFPTLWAKALDVPQAELMPQLYEASRRGLLDLRSSGDVIEVGFEHLLSPRETQEAHVSP